ncbi:MAG: alpha-amylase family glycosyl hydrolase [Polyangiaceae bacterium]
MAKQKAVGPHPTELPVGAFPQADATTMFRVWAPHAQRVDVELLDTRHYTRGPLESLPARRRASLDPIGFGLYEGQLKADPDADYVFLLDAKLRRADPASRWQPFGVHGPSRVLDCRTLELGPTAWRRPKRETLLLCQVHVGTYSPQGDFAGLAADVPRLADLGINALQLMPIAEFPGLRNWGYDGVFPYAVQSSYGGPHGLAALVAACHRAGVAVFLDLVFNHLGPEGNYTSDFGPYANSKFNTPWGHALNFDEAGSACVRRFFLDNARYWCREFHIDGYRFDAIAQIFDSSPKHILQEINETLPRTHLSIAESELNANRVFSQDVGGLGFDGQWNDDLHHALVARLTGNRSGFLQDFASQATLQKVLTDGWALVGQWSEFRQRFHGEPCGARADQLIVFSQNHDQVAGVGGGARAGGDDSTTQEVLLVLTLLSGFVPMLFQGQDFGATTPFHYFVDHSDTGLLRRVVAGRRHEQASLAPSARYLSPAAPSTWAVSRLDWREQTSPSGQRLQATLRQLTQLRRQNVCFQAHPARNVRVRWNGDLLTLASTHGASRGLLVMHLPAPSATASSANRTLARGALRRWLYPERRATQGDSQQVAIAYRTARVSESASKLRFEGPSALVVISSPPESRLQIR